MKSGPLGGTTYEVAAAQTIGREDADITIGDPQISRRHATVRPSGNGLEIEDTGSSNGTFVNGNRISSSTSLSNGDTIRVGETELEVEAAAPSSGTVIAGAPPAQGTVVAPKSPAGAGGPSEKPSKPPADASPAPPPAAYSPPGGTPPTFTPPPGQGPAPYTPPPGQGPAPYGSPGGPQGGGYGAPPTGPQYATPVRPKGAPPPSSGSKVWLWVLIGVGALLVIGVLVFFLFLRPSDEDEIRDVVTQVFASADNPEEQCDLFTDRLKEEASGLQGAEADDACREGTPVTDTAEEDLTIESVEVDGSTARAEIDVRGDQATVRLVEEDGDWLVDDFEF